MASRFWVPGGSGTWNGTDTNNWSATTGGASGASVPTASDDAFLDGNSGAGTVTLSSTSVGRSLDCLGFTGTLSHPASTTVTIGDGTGAASNSALRFSNAMTYSMGSANTAAWNFVSTSATVLSINFANKTVGNTTFNGVGGSWRLASQMTTAATSVVTLTTGTLDLNGMAVSWGLFVSTSGSTRTLTMGNSNITVTGTGTSWNTSSTGMTVTNNTATVTLSGVASLFQTSSMNWNGLSLVLSGSGACNIAGPSTTLTLANFTRQGTAAITDSFSFPGTNLVCTGTITLGGGSVQGSNRLLISSIALGTQPIFTAAAYVITGDVIFRDISLAYSGAVSWTNAGNAYIGDALGNAGAVTTNATAPVVRFWIGGTGNWSDTTHWSSSTGGTPGARSPLPQDNAIFDASSGAGTATVDVSHMCKDLDMSASSVATLAASLSGSAYGSLTFKSGMTVGWNPTMAARSAVTLTCGGSNVGTSFVAITGFNITVTLQDNLTATAAVTLFLRSGTFNANNKNVSVGIVTLDNNISNRTINMGSGTWSLTSTGSVWNVSVTTGLTINSQSSTVDITNTSNTAKTFVGAGYTYNSVRHTATGSAGLTITGSNFFTSLVLTCTTARTITLPAGGTQTVWQLFLAGASGQLLSIVSSTPGTQSTLTTPGGVAVQFVSLTDSAITAPLGALAANSTNVSNNTGWTFAGFVTANQTRPRTAIQAIKTSVV